MIAIKHVVMFNLLSTSTEAFALNRSSLSDFVCSFFIATKQQFQLQLTFMLKQTFCVA